MPRKDKTITIKYETWKELNSIKIDKQENGRYSFDKVIKNLLEQQTEA